MLLLVDGHSSRDCLENLEEANKLNIHLVQLSANLTHVIQPCDQTINRRFKDEVRTARDSLQKISSVHLGSVATRIKLEMVAFRKISGVDVNVAWGKSRIWPMDFRFVQFFNQEDPKGEDSSNKDMQKVLKRIQIPKKHLWPLRKQ